MRRLHKSLNLGFHLPHRQIIMAFTTEHAFYGTLCNHLLKLTRIYAHLSSGIHSCHLFTFIQRKNAGQILHKMHSQNEDVPLKTFRLRDTSGRLMKSHLFFWPLSSHYGTPIDKKTDKNVAVPNRGPMIRVDNVFRVYSLFLGIVLIQHDIIIANYSNMTRH